MQVNIWPTFKKKEGFHCKQQAYWEQSHTFPDYFGCRYLCILDQTSRLKQTFEEKTKLKFNHVDI